MNGPLTLCLGVGAFIITDNVKTLPGGLKLLPMIGAMCFLCLVQGYLIGRKR